MGRNSASTPKVNLNIDSNIGIPAWSLSKSTPPSEITSLAFNVPHDFSAPVGGALVIIHFCSGTANNASTGTIDLKVQALFTPPTPPPPTNTVTSTSFVTYTPITVTPVTTSLTTSTWNHYQAIITLTNTINPDDLALISFQRLPSSTYAQDIFITSLEFKY
jgi:hypothetical protein